MFVMTCLKTRGVYVLNGPTVSDPEVNKEAEKATCLTKRERDSNVSVLILLWRRQCDKNYFVFFLG